MEKHLPNRNAHESADSMSACGCCLDFEPTPAEVVYVEHAPRLRRIAMRKFEIPPDDADELVQEVLFSYFSNPVAVRSNLRAYLIGAICNASRNYWRSRRSQDRVFVYDEKASDDAVTPDVFDGVDLQLVIAATLSRLHPRCREVLKRYCLDGDDSGAVAQALNTTPTNVNLIVHKCRKSARAVYDEITRVR